MTCEQAIALELIARARAEVDEMVRLRERHTFWRFLWPPTNRRHTVAFAAANERAKAYIEASQTVRDVCETLSQAGSA